MLEIAVEAEDGTANTHLSRPQIVDVSRVLYSLYWWLTPHAAY